MLKDRFIQARRDKHKVRITFYSEADKRTFIHVCAPLDYGPGKVDRSDHFHVWDYESEPDGRILSLKSDRVSRVDVLDEEFDASDFMWFLSRDWGQHM